MNVPKGADVRDAATLDDPKILSIKSNVKLANNGTLHLKGNEESSCT